MPFYMFQVAYTDESWEQQMETSANPRDRIESLVKAGGGRLVEVFYTFGEYDLMTILEMPDEEAMAAHAIVALAGRAMRATKVTPLLTVEQGLSALKTAKATAGSYRPPVANG